MALIKVFFGSPTAAAGGAVEVIPGIATLTLTAFAPTVSTPVDVTPGIATLPLTAFATTVATPVDVTPGTAALTLTRFAPTVATPVDVTPGTAALILTTFAPTVTASSAVEVTPGTAAVTLSTFAVEVSIDDVPIVVIVGGDDAPRRRTPKNRKERHVLFQEIEATVHGLLYPGPADVGDERRGVAAVRPDAERAARRAIDELVVLAQGQHSLLQRAAALRAELQDHVHQSELSRLARMEQDDEDALIWLF